MRRLLLALALVIVGAAQGALTAGAQEEAPGPTTDPTLGLVSQTGWVAPNGDFEVRVRLPREVPEDAQVSTTVFDPIDSRSEFVGQLLGNDFGGEIQEVTLPLALVPARRDGTIDLVVRTATSSAEGRARLPEAGVYPVVVRVLDGAGNESASLVTHLVRMPEEPPAVPLGLALIVPFHAPLGIRPAGDTTFSPSDLERLDDLEDALLEEPEVPLTLSPTPETVQSLARAGTASGARLINGLQEAADGRQVLSGSYVRVDEGAWMAASLQPDFQTQLAAGDAALATHLGLRPDRRTWVAGDTLTSEALQVLREAGVDQLVVPDGAVAAVDTEAFPVTLSQPFQVEAGDGARVRAVATDAGLSGDVVSTGDPVLDAHRLLADLSVVYFDRPALDRGMVLTLPTDADLAAPFLRSLLGALSEDGLARAVTIDDLFAGVPDAAEGGETDEGGEPLVRPLTPNPPEDLGSYPNQLALTTFAVQGYAGLVGTDDPEYPTMQARLLASGERTLGAEERTEYLDGVNHAVRAVTAGVGAPPRQTVTLTSREGSIPLRLQNDTGRPVEVLLTFNSDKLEFPDGSRLRVTLGEGSTPVEVRVRSRVSGAFPLDVTVTSPDGVLTLSRSRVTVRSTAVSGVGIGIGAVAGLVLLVWWARHHRHLRRQRRLVSAEA